MKKLLIILCLLSSCQIDNRKGMVVRSIADQNGSIVVYRITELSWMGIEEHIRDTIGKFKVGDTLYFKR